MLQRSRRIGGPGARENVEEYNSWKTHRDDPDFEDVAEIPSWYLHERRDTFITSRGVGEEESLDGELQPVMPKLRPQESLNQMHKDFLNLKIDELAINPEYIPFWRGVKILGQGGEGCVGLWEYNGPPEARQLPRNVAVKQSLGGAYSRALTHEGKIHWRMCRYMPTHIVRLLLEPKAAVPSDGLDPEFNGRFRRLIMEYFPLGSLWDLIDRRQLLAMPFEEVTLWRIFDCLVDGITVMSNGSEAVVDSATGNARFSLLPARSPLRSPEASEAKWQEVYHLDLKPANIMLGDRDMNHSWTPVAKVSDFGCSEAVPPKDKQTPRWKYGLRRPGTAGYHPPEQSTKRWEYLDWETSGVAGNYGPHTNVWAIGLIMWDLATLKDRTSEYEGPVQLKPFFPSWQISKRPAKGLTHGKYLQTVPRYSQTFKDLVYECLYEKPKHRPDVLELKGRICKAWKLADSAAGSKGELWKWFIPPEPATTNIPSPNSPSVSPRPPPSIRQPISEMERQMDEERDRSPPPVTLLLLKIAYIDGPVNKERIISRFDIQVPDHHTEYSFVRGLKFRIRAKTIQHNAPWISYDNMHLQVTSIPPSRIHLNDDRRTLASYGFTLDKQPIYINLRSTPDFTYGLPDGSLQSGVSIRFNISSVTRQHSTVEFRGIQVDTNITRLKMMLFGHTNVPVWQQIWFYGNIEVKPVDEELENILLSKHITKDGEAITVWITEAKLADRLMGIPAIQEPATYARIYLTNARHEHRTMDIPNITDDTTIDDVIVAVARKSGIPIQRQRWRFGGISLTTPANMRSLRLRVMAYNEAMCAFTVWEVEETETVWVEPPGGEIVEELVGNPREPYGEGDQVEDDLYSAD
ncbi:uncharacterized protein BP5553_02415 [Venustampulla echinocandica]|uniref:Protein kinase domain-containing protein n=1 Tax=Venustampulla echinocandica TaxID=2656787 RepID=A0A370U3T9_9HELO|nr:uncharacterized protein BP5553_02415 [Venustampulla echinocandica]RDL42436.1 hypothetical protein BP5553_02415 [Venustampulla echinocandica]